VVEETENILPKSFLERDNCNLNVLINIAKKDLELVRFEIKSPKYSYEIIFRMLLERRALTFCENFLYETIDIMMKYIEKIIPKINGVKSPAKG
jgi:hypothetical protein